MKNKKGRVYGVKFHFEGQTFKVSEIGREIRWLYLKEENHARIPTFFYKSVSLLVITVSCLWLFNYY